jgi:hypothetical protein
MGYTRSRTLKLNITDPELAKDYTGEPLVVRIRPMTIGDFRRVTGMARLMHIDPKDYTAEDAEEAMSILNVFADRLVSWNVEEEDENDVRTSVPATREGVESQELPFVMGIMKEWMTVCVGVAGPLEKRSSRIRSPLEESMPMETLPASLLNLRQPG